MTEMNKEAQRVQEDFSSHEQKGRGILLLCTAYAPFGRYEVYIKNELQVLSQEFEKIYMLPQDESKGECWELPENVEAICLGPESPPSNSEILASYAPALLKALWAEYSSGEKWGEKAKRFGDELRWIKDAASRALKLERWAAYKGLDLRQVQIYSNWFVGWAEVLALMKARGVIDSFTCRAHGYDLYPERRPYGYIYFRPFHIRMADRVICISQAGMDFLTKIYPHYQGKISRSYLGVFDKGTSVIENPEAIQVLSCSNMIPLKRIHRIMEILLHLDRPIHWVHFGSGELEQELKAGAEQLPASISWEFPGRVSNEDLMAYYKEHHVDFLINVSESEGLPVSIMEAISMGIPSVATDVGGTREIVNSDTGLLIPAEFDNQKVANQILEKISTWRDPAYREGVRAFWKKHFDAGKNFQNFIQILKQH